MTFTPPKDLDDDLITFLVGGPERSPAQEAASSGEAHVEEISVHQAPESQALGKATKPKQARARRARRAAPRRTSQPKAPEASGKPKTRRISLYVDDEELFHAKEVSLEYQRRGRPHDLSSIFCEAFHEKHPRKR